VNEIKDLSTHPAVPQSSRPLGLGRSLTQLPNLHRGGGYIFFAQKRNLKNTGIPGAVALTYNFDERWATQIAANLINANSGDPSKHHLHGFIYLLDELYRLPKLKAIDPYILGGLNVTALKPGGPDTVNQFGANVGVGAQFYKHRSIALSAQAREVYTFVGSKSDLLLNLGIDFIWS
jgi:hypothetical protein